MHGPKLPLVMAGPRASNRTCEPLHPDPLSRISPRGQGGIIEALTSASEPGHATPPIRRTDLCGLVEAEFFLEMRA